mgnify:CR=1 FL=1
MVKVGDVITFSGRLTRGKLKTAIVTDDRKPYFIAKDTTINNHYFIDLKEVKSINGISFKYVKSNIKSNGIVGIGIKTD